MVEGELHFEQSIAVGMVCSPGILQVSWAGALCVVVAAFVANIAESYVGAVAQGRVGWLTNDVVNILQITLAAGLGVGLAQLIGAV